MSIKSTIEGKKKIKREFSLEKIATAIHCENIISSLRNKYIDPLILHRKNAFPKTKSKQFKKNQTNDPFSLDKILCHQFIKQKQETEEEKAIQTKSNLSNMILPIISNKQLQQINSNNNLNEINSNKKSDTLLITSGMFKQKECFKEPSQKVKLGCIINLKKNKNDLNNINNIYPKIGNIKKINEKYNLQLDLKHLYDNNNKTLQKPRKMSKKGLMNYLFKKYATSTSDLHEENLDNDSNIKAKKKNKNKKQNIISIISRNNQINEEFIKSNSYSNSIDSDNMSIDILKREFFNEDKNTFLTKMTNNESKEISAYNNDISTKKKVRLKNIKIYEKNKDIINHDQKVTIDCLYSNVRAKIEPNKLVYKSIEKTTFELQKEPSYKKVKKFESIIDKIMKNQQKV